jgi:hypothetical protein
MAGLKQVPESEDFEIGTALGGLAKTLEAAAKLEEARTYRQQTLLAARAVKAPMPSGPTAHGWIWRACCTGWVTTLRLLPGSKSCGQAWPGSMSLMTTTAS